MDTGDLMQAPGFDEAGVHKLLDERSHPNRQLGHLYEAGGESVVDYQPAAKTSPSETSKQTKVINDYGMKAHLAQEKSSDSAGLQAMPDSELPQTTLVPEARPSAVDDSDLADDEGDQSILEMIYEAFVPLDLEGSPRRDWLSLDKLQDIFQPDRVRKELAKHFEDPNLVDAFVEYVCGNPAVSKPNSRNEDVLARRTLAILILIQGNAVRQYLPRLVEHKIKDKHLPFSWANSKYPNSHQLLDCNGRPLTFLGTRASFTKQFYNIQWQMLAPFITRDSDQSVHEYRMHKDAIFPWTCVDPVKRQSTFGKVARVDIHPAHHTFHEEHFALKTLHETETNKGDQEFQAELRVFTKMKPKPNLLTELYATFVVESDGGTQYSFLFPWAEGGSMDQLLEKSPMRLIDTDTTPRLLLQWLAEQCHGLADGLRSIHDTREKALERAMESNALSPEVSRGLTQIKKELPTGQNSIDQDNFGIHGDLKPENILHFTQSRENTGLGTLKIADFGLTQFFTRSRRSPLAIIPGIHAPALLTYSAPELMIKNEHYSRKADIWALGCIFSELISWVILGQQGVEDYRLARSNERNKDPSGHFKSQCWRNDSFFRAEFGDLDSDPKTFLKDAVREQHMMLKAKLRRPVQVGSDILTDLLDFIEEKMLDPRRKMRISCDDLVGKLGLFQKRQQESSHGDPYWDPPLPSFEPPRGVNSEGASLAVPNILVNGQGQI